MKSMCLSQGSCSNNSLLPLLYQSFLSRYAENTDHEHKQLQAYTSYSQSQRNNMARHDQQKPSPLGTRLPAPILTKIYRLAIVSSTPIPLASTTYQTHLPALLQTSSLIRSRFLPIYFERNTFTIRRASLCVSTKTSAKAKESRLQSLPPSYHHLTSIRHLHLSTYNGVPACLGLEAGNPFRNDGKKKKKHNVIATRLKALRQSPSQHFRQQKHACCRFCNPATFPASPRALSVPLQRYYRCRSKPFVRSKLAFVLPQCDAWQGAVLGRVDWYWGRGVEV